MVADTRRAVSGWVPSDLTRGQRVTAAALTLIALQLAFRAWAVYGGWFYGDDLEFLSVVARGDGADLKWMFAPHDLQFMPLGLLMAKLVGVSGDYNWPLAATEIIVMQAIANLTCWWMLCRLFGTRARNLLPLGFYLLCVASVPSIMWWAAALNQIPVHAVIFAGVALHVSYLRERRLVFVLLTSLVLVIGLLCYVKAVFLPLILVPITVAYFVRGGFRNRSIRALTRFWPAWAAYGIVCAAYLVMYAIRIPDQIDSDKADYAGVANTMILESLGTGLLGGPWRWEVIGTGPRVMTDPPAFLVTTSWIVIAAALVLVHARSRRALRPLWFVAPYAVLSYLVIATGRSATFGADSGREIRYWSDFMPVVALAVALSTMSIRGSVEGAVKRRTPLVTIDFPRWLGLLGAIVFTAGCISSSIGVIRPWHEDYPTRAYVTTARQSLEADRQATQLIDTTAPPAVMYPATFPYNLTSRLMAPVAPTFAIRQYGNDLQILDQSGRPVDAEVKPGTKGVPGPVKGCGYLLEPGAPTTIELESSAYDYPFWISLGYYANANGLVEVVAGSNDVDAPIRKGVHTLFVSTEGSYSAVTLTPAAGTTICAGDLTVGPATPREQE